MADLLSEPAAARRPHAGESGISWVVAGVGLTLAFYCLTVVVPYAASTPGSSVDPWDGAVGALALFAVQVAPLVALVAGPWSAWTGLTALRRGREGVAAMAGASVVLCGVLAGLSVSPVGLSVFAVMID